MFADGEVIVAAGALVTPQLLMLSGIGPADQLRAHGIACLADLPGVGENLIDHPEVPIVADGERAATATTGRASAGACSATACSSSCSAPARSCRRASRPAPSSIRPIRDAEPTIQAFCVPIVYLDRDTLGLVEDTYGLTITTVVVKPKSRGFVRLRSANPADMPLVSPNLLKRSGRRSHHDRRPALLPAGLPDQPAGRADRARSASPIPRTSATRRSSSTAGAS